MKTTILLTVVSLAIATTAMATQMATGSVRGNPSSGENNLVIRITSVRTGTGTILVALTTPAGSPGKSDKSDIPSGTLDKSGNPAEVLSAMIPAREGVVEWSVSRESVTPQTLIYVFHDLNGNYTLDRAPDGTPLEDCASGPVEIDAHGTATIELKHFD